MKIAKNMINEILLTYTHAKRVSLDNMPIVIMFNGFCFTFDDADIVKSMIDDSLSVNNITVSIEKHGISFDSKFAKKNSDKLKIIEIIERDN